MNTQIVSNPNHNGANRNGSALIENAPVVTSADRDAQDESVSGAHREADLKTRNRDKWGNRLGWFYHFDIPFIEDVPLEKTPLAPAVARIGEALPLRAADLAHFYDHKLRPAYRRLLAVRDEEEAQLAAWNAGAAQTEAQIDAERATIEAERDAATTSDREALLALDEPLTLAHRDAAAKVARTGGSYDAENPSPACVLRHERAQLEVIAGMMGLPWTPADKKVGMSAIGAGATTALTGAMVGTSIGIMAGALHSDDLLGQPYLLALFALAGCAPAFLGKKALYLSGREASQRYWMDRPWTNWMPFVALLTAVGATILLIDANVEKEGLLANTRLREMVASLSGSAHHAGGPGELTFFFAAILLSFPYIAFNLWDGYLSGRYDACLNRARARQEAEFARSDDAHRADPKVQDALEAIARVLGLLRHKAMLTARIAATAAPFEQHIAQIETRRKSEREELSEAACQRVQDARDNFLGAQGLFEQKFHEACAECEPPSGFWKRLLHALFGYRSPRYRTGEKKRNVG